MGLWTENKREQGVPKFYCIYGKFTLNEPKLKNCNAVANRKLVVSGNETKFRMSLIRCFRTGPEHEIPNELLTSTPYSQPMGIASDKMPPQSEKSAYYLCADKFSHTVHQ